MSNFSKADIELMKTLGPAMEADLREAFIASGGSLAMIAEMLLRAGWRK
jgi:TctA family transporter